MLWLSCPWLILRREHIKASQRPENQEQAMQSVRKADEACNISCLEFGSSLVDVLVRTH